MTTVNDLIARYRDEEMGHLAQRTAHDYRRNLEILSKQFGHYEADKLRPRDIGQFMDVKKGRIQRGKIVSVLSSIYKLAVGKWWLVEVNPCTNLVMPKGKPRTRYVTQEEFAAVKSICPPPYALAMDLAYVTGQRQGDIVNMGWDQVEVFPKPREENGIMSYGRIHVRQSKTGKQIAINITETLKDILVACKRRPPALPRLYLIRTRTGQPFSNCGFRTGWQRIMNRAVREGLIKERFRYHDIRAASCSDNKDIVAASALLGHQSLQMTKNVYDRSVRVVQPLK